MRKIKPVNNRNCITTLKAYLFKNLYLGITLHKRQEFKDSIGSYKLCRNPPRLLFSFLDNVTSFGSFPHFKSWLFFMGCPPDDSSVSHGVFCVLPTQEGLSHCIFLGKFTPVLSLLQFKEYPTKAM